MMCYHKSAKQQCGKMKETQLDILHIGDESTLGEGKRPEQVSYLSQIAWTIRSDLYFIH